MAAFSFRSVWVENVTLNKGTSVWNVKKSSDDKWEGQKNPNWLRVWNAKTNSSITSDSGTCYVKGSVKTNGTSHCDGNTFGGHMALSASTVNPTRDDFIYIVPICNSHNNYRNVAQMTISENVTAVKMNRFME